MVEVVITVEVVMAEVEITAEAMMAEGGETFRFVEW